MQVLKLFPAILFTWLLIFAGPALSVAQKHNPGFSISFAGSVSQTPVTGRVFIAISEKAKPEPRFQAGSFFKSVPFWGKDVDQLQPGKNVIIDTADQGYPIANLRDLPAGDYYVQAVMNVYTRFSRADGHTIWAHQDQWEGQHFYSSPGNFISKVQQIHYDPSQKQLFSIKLDSVLPPINLPADTKQVKHLKFRSKILSDFWGHDMFLGATVLLPQGYDDNPSVNYPVVYEQGHFGLRPSFGFSTDERPIPPNVKAILENNNIEPGFQFQSHYNAPRFPRMLVVKFQHPTPYYDASYAVNSANNGPYGDAIMQELIPYIESQYRIIRQSYARLLTGGSTGGWETMALQIHHPDFFGGAWAICPDPLDFRHFQLMDLTKDSNAFYANNFEMLFEAESNWQPTYRFMMQDDEGQPIRTTKDASRLESVLGTHGRSGEQFGIFDAVFGPIGKDGYPVPLFDKITGKINAEAVNYAREQGYDLTYYLEKNWKEIGPKLIDKLHVYVGDHDNFYLYRSVYSFQEFLKQTQNPHYEGTFEYGRPMKGHGWSPMIMSELLKIMADHITKHAPAGTDTEAWKY